MPELGRMLMILGGIILVMGLALTLAPQLPWLGRLPGDIYVKGERFTFAFPIVTCLVVSVVLTLLMNLFFRN